MGLNHVLLLFSQQSVEIFRERLFEGFLVSLLGCVFSLLGCYQEGVIPAPEIGLHIGPCPVHSPSSGTAAFRVVLPWMMERVWEMMEGVFKLAGEPGAYLTLFQEERLDAWILDVASAFSKGFLPVMQRLHYGTNRFLHALEAI
jgi:hypothetical protein